MKVCCITTVRHNVGDDFVREGIRHLLGKVIGPFESVEIHKHFPATARPEWDWFHRAGLTKIADRIPGFRAEWWSRRIDALPLRPETDKVLTADLLVQCGAPVYWLNAHSDSSRNEWYEPLIGRRWERVSDRVPLLNLGAGACQPWESDGSEFRRSAGALEFIRSFSDRCALTTLRDKLSGRILEIAGRSAELLPCPSLFARLTGRVEKGQAEYLALNYMPLGGHYRFGNDEDRIAWRQTFRELALRFAKHERCLLVCHDRAEFREAGRLLPEIPRFQSDDFRDYLRVYSKARCGVLNRVHGAFAMASFGRPALVVGNDSRARMMEVIGLPAMSVAGATLGKVFDALAALNAEAPAHEERLARLCAESEARYCELLEASLASVRKVSK